MHTGRIDVAAVVERLREIHEDQLSLRYFREILSFLVLGQLTGVIGILREKWLARAIRNPGG